MDKRDRLPSDGPEDFPHVRKLDTPTRINQLWQRITDRYRYYSTMSKLGEGEMPEWHLPFMLPGYNYCGPGNPMLGLPPINRLDQICMEHDIGYGLIGSSAYTHYNWADQKLYEALRNINPADRTTDEDLVIAFFFVKALNTTWGDMQEPVAMQIDGATHKISKLMNFRWHLKRDVTGYRYPTTTIGNNGTRRRKSNGAVTGPVSTEAPTQEPPGYTSGPPDLASNTHRVSHPTNFQGGHGSKGVDPHAGGIGGLPGQTPNPYDSFWYRLGHWMPEGLVH